MSSGNGNQLVVFFGSMALVRESVLLHFCPDNSHYVVAGSGKTVLWCVLPQLLF